ncbi:MAG TPA: hypothetical protein VF160_08190 [Candidatus Dormibacteraeota bacterium]
MTEAGWFDYGAELLRTVVGLLISVDGWWWAERLSWIVTLLGLPAVFIAILQLVRRPKVRVGFPRDPGGTARRLATLSDSTEIDIHWAAGAQLSDPVQISVVVMNDHEASATALDVNFEVRYPIALVPVPTPLPQPPGMPNIWSISRHDIVLNPGAIYWIRTTFRVPAGTTQVPLFAIVSMRDARARDKKLSLSVRPV